MSDLQSIDLMIKEFYDELLNDSLTTFIGGVIRNKPGVHYLKKRGGVKFTYSKGRIQSSDDLNLSGSLIDNFIINSFTHSKDASIIGVGVLVSITPYDLSDYLNSKPVSYELKNRYDLAFGYNKKLYSNPLNNSLQAYFPVVVSAKDSYNKLKPLITESILDLIELTAYLGIKASVNKDEDLYPKDLNIL